MLKQKTSLSIGSAVVSGMLFLSAATASAAEKITYHHFDALGSPVAATDEQGNVLWRETYQPYGQRIRNEEAAANNTRWYTGHPQDPETGLVYAGARYYDPVIGRFYAVDPKPFAESDLYSFNQYAYGNNNPYKFIDPDGREVVFSAEAEKPLSRLMVTSPTARSIMRELARSQTIYEIVIDSNARNPAFTETINEHRWIKISINPEGLKDFQIRDADGRWVDVSVERAIAHELGHAITIERSGSAKAQFDKQKYREATEYENRIARELDPSAPLRDMSGDGHAARRRPTPLE